MYIRRMAPPRSDPDAAREPATTEIIDFDYEIMDIQGQLLDVVATLAAERAQSAQQPQLYLFPQDWLSALSPANLLKLL